MNILDYIDWRGDLSFAQSDFNEVDNLIFSELVYLELKDLIGEDETVSIADIWERYSASGIDQSFMINDPKPLLRKTASCARFKDIAVSRYREEIDAEKQIQFSAMTFLIGKDLTYISFSGTDNTIVGWREDCNFAFLPETPGQVEAAKYVDMVARNTSGRLIVGGHSKGGNFAVYGAAFCDEDVRESRIVKIYSNDGPGFNDEIASAEQYLAVLPKTVKIIPDSSLVGILLSSKAQRTIIKSEEKGVLQHDPYSWRVLGNHFEKADEQSGTSVFMDETLGRWIDSLSTDNKRILVNTIFDALEASGVSTLQEINKGKITTYSAILKAVGETDSDSKKDVIDIVKKLFAEASETAKEQSADFRQKQMDKLKEKLAEFGFSDKQDS